MTRDDATALLAVLPDASSPRAKRFATEVATRYPATSSGMGLVLPPLVLNSPPPAWSPDAPRPAPPTPPAPVNPFEDFVATSVTAPAASTASWWPPSPTALKAGVGVLAIGVLAWAVFFRRRGATAAAPAQAPIVIVSSRPEVPATKANRPRFVKKGAR